MDEEYTLIGSAYTGKFAANKMTLLGEDGKATFYIGAAVIIENSTKIRHFFSFKSESHERESLLENLISNTPEPYLNNLNKDSIDVRLRYMLDKLQKLESPLQTNPEVSLSRWFRVYK